MSSTREFAIQERFTKFDKRDTLENREDGRNDTSPGGVLAIVIAALTLLVTMIPLFRSLRFGRWVSSLIPPFIKVYQPSSFSLNLSTYTSLILGSCTENFRNYCSKFCIDSGRCYGKFRSIPAPELFTPSPVFIYNNSSSVHPFDYYCSDFLDIQNGTAREHGRVLRIEESLVTNTFPSVFSLNGERLIVVHIVIVDYLHSLVGGSLISIKPEGTKSNR